MMRTFMLMSAMTALVGGLGLLLGGEGGLVIALLIAAGMNFVSYWNSDKMVLSMHGARRVDRASAPKLVSMVESLAQRANLPVPAVYIMQNDQPNAFATGRNPQHAAVAATTGLLARLSDAEIEAVMAHELAHIKNRDTLLMTLTATLAGAISMLANFAMFFGHNRNNPMGFIGTLALMILAPLAAALVQMAISRTREYAADRVGAEICGRPDALASALQRISARPVANPQAEQNPATAHLFIANPLSAKRALAGLFSTHPPMQERIRRLMDMRAAVQANGRQAPVRGSAARPSGSSGIPQSDRARKGPWG